MNDLFFLLTFLVLSVLFAVASVAAGFVFGYYSDNTDNSTYECGMKLFGDAKVKFDIKFLNYAIIFLIFDASVFFLFPYAIAFGEMKLFVLIEIIVFLLLFLFILLFAAKKNLLRWNKWIL